MNELENFGQFIRKKRIERKISLRKFSIGIGMSFSHWSEIETSKKNPPKNEILDLISQLLELSDEDRNTMYTLAGISKKTLAPDILDYVMENIYIIDILRFAKNQGMNKDDWDKFFEFVNIKKG